MSTTAILHPNPVCPQCGCKSTARKGKRRNRLQTLQVYRCTECLHRFTGEPGKNKTYPLRVILETVSTFNLGHSLTGVAHRRHRDFFPFSKRRFPFRIRSNALITHPPPLMVSGQGNRTSCKTMELRDGP